MPGKYLHIADALSRAPTSQSTPSDDQFCPHVDNFGHLVTGSLPVTEERLQQISRLQDEDGVCQQLKLCCLNGWPETWKIKGLVKHYRQVSSEIAIQDSLLMHNNWIIIPSLLQQEILSKSIPAIKASSNAEKEQGSLFGCCLVARNQPTADS